MQTRVTVTSDYETVSHEWYPADQRCHAFGVLRFGTTEVHLYAPVDIDAVTAELAALRAEMTGETDDACRLTAKGEAVLAAGAVIVGETWTTAQDEPDEPVRRGCKCGHQGALHHLNFVGGELTYCNACNDCELYEYDAPAPDKVPAPTGLCGHPVTPGAWSQGFHVCRDCVPDAALSVDAYDRATAGGQLPQAVTR